jgi:hypothetical protein
MKREGNNVASFLFFFIYLFIFNFKKQICAKSIFLRNLWFLYSNIQI